MLKQRQERSPRRGEHTKENTDISERQRKQKEREKHRPITIPPRGSSDL